jgi:hypothetical protein
MADTSRPGWFTTQLRVRQATHDYLADQAQKSGISITQAAGVILEYACEQHWQIGRVAVVRQVPAVVTRLEESQQDQSP